MNDLVKVYHSLRSFELSRKESWMVLFRRLWIKIKYKKNIYAHPSFQIKGVSNIHAKDLWLGTHYRGFETRYDSGILNIKGQLNIDGNYRIGKGCRIDISKGATVSIGKNGYINSNTNIIISKGLNIGDDCAISWGCQFLDNDFHEITIDGNKKNKSSEINIGNHVWIGCGVKIYKGVKIPSNCVIASDSCVKDVFHEENCLIGGNPARILKHNIDWN